MKVLVIGSGGREHALAWKSSQDDAVTKVFVCPGNAGTALEEKLENISLDLNNFEEIADFCKNENIALVIIGPEQPLVMGMTDFLQAKDISTFGPSEAAAQLEGSKTFSKDFFVKYGIPTAGYAAFDSFDEALMHLDQIEFPTVVKADGLAAGKGVIICNTKNEAVNALESIFKDQAFGEAGSSVVIEDFLEGEEASFIAVVSKDKIIPLATSQDHKAVGEGDIGLNTGGMGTYSPVPFLKEDKLSEIASAVIEPWLSGCAREGIDFRGMIYPGIMLTDEGPKVLEFNARFGDPETQIYLTRLKNDLVDLFEASINGTLDEHELQWTEQSAVCVVIASGGYPSNYEKGKVISGLEDADAIPGVKVFHAGTKMVNGEFLTAGGRVLGVTALGDNLLLARNLAYEAAAMINFDGAFIRKDIAAKAL